MSGESPSLRTTGPVPSPPAVAGTSLDLVDTPALALDLDVFEANLRAMHGSALPGAVSIRAHAKAHKCVEIARRQIAAGSRGICCQKLAEAEVFVDAGIDDVLLTNQVATPAKAMRVASLARRARFAVCVDHPHHVGLLAQAMRGSRATLEILIELDVGGGRCGVGSPPDAVEIARAIRAHPSLRLRGLQAYQGRAQHLRLPAERAAAVAKAAGLAAEVRDALREAGEPCAVVTGGGTGSFRHEAASGVYTEVQPGSYVLMDGDYLANVPDADGPRFASALAVHCSVLSTNGRRVVLDAGLKALAVDSGLPAVAGGGWKTLALSDEHMVVEADAATAVPPIGARLVVQPSHCDPTVNLHDWLVAHRGSRVDAVWRVDARGALT